MPRAFFVALEKQNIIICFIFSFKKGNKTTLLFSAFFDNSMFVNSLSSIRILRQIHGGLG
ncbi:MAG: hypothetical protein DKM50_14255 [Candidatus Margulisiibacteriota bacterium]|nr:MAG: hypothetical protein DKM50_14255 [Candidatus Margulisiibacteriota bacterium]